MENENTVNDEVITPDTKGRPGRKKGSVSDGDKAAMAEGRRKATEAKGELKVLVTSEDVMDATKWNDVPFEKVQAIYAAITASLKSREAERKAMINAKIAALETLG